MSKIFTVYVLVRVEPGLDREVLQKVRKLRNVKNSVTVYGEYDMIMEIELETLDELDSFIFDTVRRISGVDNTTTLITTKIPD